MGSGRCYILLTRFSKSKIYTTVPKRQIVASQKQVVKLMKVSIQSFPGNDKTTTTFGMTIASDISQLILTAKN